MPPRLLEEERDNNAKGLSSVVACKVENEQTGKLV